MPDQATYLTTRQLQELLQVDRLTIYRMLDAGEIPAFKVGRQWRFDSREIKRWLSGQGEAQSVGNEQTELAARSQGTENLPLAGMQTIQDSFAQALGLRLVIVTDDNRALTTPSNEQPLEQLLQTTSGGMGYLTELIEREQKPVLMPEEEASVGLLSQALQLGQQLQASLCCGPFVYAERKELLKADLVRIAQASDLPSESLSELLLKTRMFNATERSQLAAILASVAVALETLVEQDLAFQHHLQKIANLASRRVGEL